MKSNKLNKMYIYINLNSFKIKDLDQNIKIRSKLKKDGLN